MTPAEVNALPERVRRYIHDLETSASMQENARLREEIETAYQRGYSAGYERCNIEVLGCLV